MVLQTKIERLKFLSKQNNYNLQSTTQLLQGRWRPVVVIVLVGEHTGPRDTWTHQLLWSQSSLHLSQDKAGPNTQPLAGWWNSNGIMGGVGGAPALSQKHNTCLITGDKSTTPRNQGASREWLQCENQEGNIKWWNVIRTWLDSEVHNNGCDWTVF